MSSLKLNKHQPLIIAVISFVVLILLIFQFTKFYNNNKEKDIRNNLLDLLNTKKSLLEKSLNSRIYYTKGIAAYTSINPNITEEVFYQLADKLIQKDSVIGSMSLSKDCIIGAVFPIDGHEAAIGLNLLLHPQRRKIVESTIRTRNTFIAGPVELIEGGIAFISYTPIFTKVESDSSKFWGVTDIVILMDKLFNEINFFTKDENYQFALRGTGGTGKTGPIFWGDGKTFENNPVVVDILLPTGNWQLASVPIAGWKKYIDKTEVITIILYLSAIVISLLIWLLSKAIIKIKMHGKELKALFGSMNDIIIEFNNRGEYVKIAPTNDSLLFLPKQDMLGKSIYQIFDKEKAEFFMDAITKCINSKENVIIEYKLEIDSKILWFLARISYISDSSVLYVAHDNTTKKLAEEKLKKSEQALIELNATKDKLFSIIAHDLRSPFNTTLGFVEILKEDMNILSEEEIQEHIEVIYNSLNSQFKLLENLLNWARLQTGKMKVELKEILLARFADDIIDLLSANAKEKQIIINNKIEKNINISADENMLRSIINNLICNAIKFTNSGGSVTLSSKFVDDNHQIIVSDTGVGMMPDDIESIFNIDRQHTTLGTYGEEGTGLGLALVKEMIEKHNGTIVAKSEVGKGSDFIFTLPIT